MKFSLAPPFWSTCLSLAMKLSSEAAAGVPSKAALLARLAEAIPHGFLWTPGTVLCGAQSSFQAPWITRPKLWAPMAQIASRAIGNRQTLRVCTVVRELLFGSHARVYEPMEASMNAPTRMAL